MGLAGAAAATDPTSLARRLGAIFGRGSSLGLTLLGSSPNEPRIAIRSFTPILSRPREGSSRLGAWLREGVRLPALRKRGGQLGYSGDALRDPSDGARRVACLYASPPGPALSSFRGDSSLSSNSGPAAPAAVPANGGGYGPVDCATGTRTPPQKGAARAGLHSSHVPMQQPQAAHAPGACRPCAQEAAASRPSL